MERLLPAQHVQGRHVSWAGKRQAVCPPCQTRKLAVPRARGGGGPSGAHAKGLEMEHSPGLILCHTWGKPAAPRRPSPASFWECRGQRTPLHFSQGCPGEGRCRPSAPFGQLPLPGASSSLGQDAPGTSPVARADSGPSQTRLLLCCPFHPGVGLTTDNCAPSWPIAKVQLERGGYRGLEQSASDRWTRTSHQTEPRGRRPHPQQQRQRGRWSA